jgi:integrase/recombinase XerD
LNFAQRELHKRPSALDLADLDTQLITAFLTHLEQDRHNSVWTRNARLAAIRSMFRYAALRHPEHSALIQQVLAIPDKRSERTVVTFLTDTEVNALDRRPGPTNPDRPARSGPTDSRCPDRAAHLRAHRPHLCRCPAGPRGTRPMRREGAQGARHPLTTASVSLISEWLTEIGKIDAAPLFPAIRNTRLSADAVQKLVAKHVNTASGPCPSLLDKHVTPHSLRHTAMRLLHAGVHPIVIALSLGHESIQSTNAYVHADMTLKERALERTVPLAVRPGRYRAPDPLLAFLEAL